MIMFKNTLDLWICFHSLYSDRSRISIFCSIVNGLVIFSIRGIIFVFLFCMAHEGFLLLRYILFVLLCLLRLRHAYHPFFLLRINVIQGSRLVSIASYERFWFFKALSISLLTPSFHFEFCNSIKSCFESYFCYEAFGISAV